MKEQQVTFASVNEYGTFQMIPLGMDMIPGPLSEYWVGGHSNKEPNSGSFTVRDIRPG